MKFEKFGTNWSKLNLDSPYEKSLNILDGYNSETLLNGNTLQS